MMKNRGSYEDKAGGIAKGHPNEKDLEAAVSFVAGLQ